jgi:hypothetical protein
MAAKKAQKLQKGNLTFMWVRLQPDVMPQAMLVDCVDVVRLKPDPQGEAPFSAMCPLCSLWLIRLRG